MFNFFKGIKQKVQSSLHSTPPQPVYKQYTHAQLKIIAMKTRLTLQEMYNKQKQKISLKDSQFKKLQFNKSSLNQQYQVLQQIGKKIIEVESIKLYIQFLRKIEAYSPQIINKKGDIALLKQQIQWFQCILWYRKCKKLSNIQQFNTFCYNFFKGVDITQQLNVNCQLFKIYQQLKYLQQGSIVPINQLVNRVAPCVSFEITQEELNVMRGINQNEIRQKELKEKEKKQKERLTYGNIDGNSQNNAVVNPFDIIGQRMTQNNFSQQQSSQSQQQYQFNPQQQQYPQQYNPNQLKPQGHQQQYAINQHTTSQIPFLPQRQQQHYPNTHSIDDEFAIDRFSRNIITDNHPINNNINNKYPPTPPTINKPTQKSFKSSKLNLIDWQSMYGNKHKQEEQQQQFNPYIVNSSKLGLMKYNANNEYSTSSNNQYDQTSLPYPPSGVITVEQPIKPKQNDNIHHYYIDTLQKYQSQPIKNNDDSFIKGIESAFFVNNNQKKIENNKLTEQQLMLKQILQSQNKQKRDQQQHIQKPKSFNKLFGKKYVSSNLEQNIIPAKDNQINQQQQNKQQQQQHKLQNINLIQFLQQQQKQQKQQQNKIHVNENNNRSIENQLYQMQKKIQQDQIQQYLKYHHYLDDNGNNYQRDNNNLNSNNHNHRASNENNNNTNHDNRDDNDINKQLRQLQKEIDNVQITDNYYNELNQGQYSSQSNGRGFIEEQTDEKNIDEDIKGLIQSRKDEMNSNSNNKQQQTFQQQTHLIYPIDNDRLDSSTLRFSQQTLLQDKENDKKNQYQTNKQQFGHLQNVQSSCYDNLPIDLLDSLNIIRRHFGQEIIVQSRKNQQHQNTYKNPQVSSSSHTPKPIKKPYMVSIYARQDYLDSVKQSKNQQKHQNQ